MTSTNKKYNLFDNLLILSLAHGLFDTVTIWLLFFLIYKYHPTIYFSFYWILIYNGLAFGTQFIFGLILDKIKAVKPTVLLSFILAAAALGLISINPIVSIILAGLGNALFHVSAGSISLNLTPGKAWAPGIFVAPGALGVFIGLLLGKNGYSVTAIFLLLLIVFAFLIWRLNLPSLDYQRKPISHNKFWLVIFICLFSAIIIRSLIGSVAVVPWKTDIILFLVLTILVVLGKALGGWWGDKFGWLQLSVIATLLSAPLLAFTLNIPALAILGFFLFNLTMPITLVGLAKILPGRPGLAFGLTCLALFLGFVLSINKVSLLGQPVLILLIILISCGLLFNGLKLLNINPLKNAKN